MDVNEHNKEVERVELEEWALQPDKTVAYYDEGGKVVTTWLGTVTGRITRFNVYRHNFGGRFASLQVRGTNGASYHGRASYDNGNAVVLRRVS